MFALASELFRKTMPMIMGVLSLMSFQLVDSAFIGQLGVMPLAAQGFTLPVQTVIMGLQVGFGVSATVLIGKALGAERERQARELAALIVVMGCLVIFSLCVLIYLFRHGILALLGASEDINVLIDSYWPWWLLSVWMGAFLYFQYSVCRSHGNTMLPGTMMMVASFTNMALDPLMMFVLGLGLKGAAIATALSFGLAIVIVARRVKREQWLEFQFVELNLKTVLPEIFHIQAPAMLSQMMPSVSALMATKLLATFGTTAVAAWALGFRFEMFAIVVVLALTMALPPMISRAWGAGDLERIEGLVKIALMFVLGWQLVIAIMAWLVSEPLANLMTNHQEVSNLLQQYLALVPFSLGALGSCMLLVSVSNALGKSYAALTISIVRLFALYLPCIWIGSRLNGISGIYMGAFIANLLAGGFAFLRYRKTLTDMRRISQQQAAH